MTSDLKTATRLSRQSFLDSESQNCRFFLIFAACAERDQIGGQLQQTASESNSKLLLMRLVIVAVNTGSVSN